MNCREVRPLLMAWIDSELDTRTTVEIEQHLSACAPCRLRAEAERRVEEALAAALAGDGERCPPAVWQRIVDRLAGEPALRPARPRWRRAAVLVPLALAAGLALAVGLDRLRPAPPAVPLAQELAARHAEAAAGRLAPVASGAALDGWLAERGLADWRHPQDGPVDGHPLAVVGAALTQVDGTTAVAFEFTCCGFPGTLFVLDPGELGRLPQAVLRQVAAGGRADWNEGDLHLATWLQDGRLLAAVSAHELVPGLGPT